MITRRESAGRTVQQQVGEVEPILSEESTCEESVMFSVFIHSLIATVVAIFASVSYYVSVQDSDTYRYLVSGFTTYSDLPKSRDVTALLLGMGVFLLVFLYSRYALNKNATREAHIFGVEKAIFIAATPSGIWFGQFLGGLPPSNFWLTTSAVGLILILAVVTVENLFSRSNRAIASPGSIAFGALIPLLAAATPHALNVAANRLGFDGAIDPHSWSLIAGVLSTVAVLTLLAQGRPEAAPLLHRLIQYAQIPLLLFFLILIPPTLIAQDGTQLAPKAEIGTYIISGGFILAGLLSVLWKPSTSIGVSPITLGGLLLYVSLTLDFAPSLPIDDYHFGESNYPMWALLKFGQIPYVDIIPAHGLINYLPSAVSILLFDGTIATYGASYTIIRAIILVISLVLMSRWVGVSLAWPIVYFVIVLPPVFITLTFILCALGFATKTLPRPVWIPVWTILGVSAVLLSPAQGIALVIGTLPIGIFISIQFLKYDHLKFKNFILIISFLFGFVFLTPLPFMIFGALRYVLENSALNAWAYGIPWSIFFRYSVFEVARSAWVLVPLVAVLLVIDQTRPIGTGKSKLLIVGVAVLFPLVIVGYSMGRIDDGLSRNGTITIWTLIVILPVLLGKLRPRAAYIALLGGVVVSSLLLPRDLSGTAYDLNGRARFELSGIVDAEELGLSGVGRVGANSEHLQRLSLLKTYLDGHLEPEQTYLDMTGRGAQYFYLGRRMPIEVGAPYNMPHPMQQRRAVERLEKDPPPLVLLQADNLPFDGGNDSLRAHGLYRWVVENYRPVAEGAFLFGIPRDRPLNEAELVLYDQRFREADLARLPVVWGRSFEELNAEMTGVETLTLENAQWNDVGINAEGRFEPTGGDPYVVLPLDGLRGRDAGLLALDFECIGGDGTQPYLQVFWADGPGTPFNEEASLLAQADAGKLVIPLDSQPRWLSADNLAGLRVDLANFSSCSSFSFDTIELMQRSELMAD